MRRLLVVLASAVILGVAAPLPAAAGDGLPAGTRFWTPPPGAAALAHIKALKKKGKKTAARRVRALVDTPQAVWFTGGTPAEVADYAAEVIAAARAADRVPMLVVYNIPGRDCGLYSDGGAPTGKAYRNWIDAIAAELGTTAALIVVEPDALSLLPSDCGQPDTYDRLALIRYAATTLAGDPNAAVYIDAGNADWNSPGVTAERLVAAGVDEVAGFALNVSNFQWTPNSNQYGRWVSQCIAYATLVEPGDFDACPDQWRLSSFGRWSDTQAKKRFNTAAENAAYAALLGDVHPTTHFVVDTSRNGRGPWPGTRRHPASRTSTEAWCNPPERGAGKRPTADTGVALVDAYVWIKTPGESDGECFRWGDGPKDPLRKRRDPAAGEWFRPLARELAANARPAL